MFEAQRRDNSDIGRHGACGVQSPPKAGLQQEHVGLLISGDDQCDQQRRLEKSEGKAGGCGHGVNLGECIIEHDGGNRSPVDSNPLLYAYQMR